MKHQPELTCFRYVPYVVGPKYRWECRFAYEDRAYANSIALEKANERLRAGNIVLKKGCKIIQCQL